MLFPIAEETKIPAFNTFHSVCLHSLTWNGWYVPNALIVNILPNFGGTYPADMVKSVFSEVLYKIPAETIPTPPAN